ncbi:MAG: flagellar motor protein MotB [Limisphaerales bacterium]
MAGGGGSWKVAYADFTTAMMALFMCLWLMATSTPEELEAISNYFKPSAAKKTLLPAHDGLLPNPSVQSSKLPQQGEQAGPKNLDVIRARNVKKELLELLEKDPTIQNNKNFFEVKLTPEGVKISIFNKPETPLFEDEKVALTKQGEWLLGNLAYTFDRLPQHKFEIQGHTHAQVDENGLKMDSWKLSADRATLTRAFFIKQNVLPDQITEVSGYGDTQPLKDQNRENRLNDRVDLLIKVGS